MDWLRNIFGTFVLDGEPAKRMFKIPVYQRSIDGAVFTAGTVVNFGLKVFIVQDVCMSSDLLKVNVTLVDINAAIPVEEVILGIDEVIPMPRWKMAEALNQVSKTMSNDSNLQLLDEIQSYPNHMKKNIRKFILVSKIRTYIQNFLHGLEMIGSVNLGPLDWAHDPVVLGLTSMSPKIIYRIEDDSNTGLSVDQLLGPMWDMVDLKPTVEGYRIILTLEIIVSTLGDICVTTHAAMCSEGPDLDHRCYRQQYLKFTLEQSMEHCSARALSSVPLSPDQDHDLNKTSLMWDSFSREGFLLSTPLIHDHQNCVTNDETANTTTAAQVDQDHSIEDEKEFSEEQKDSFETPIILKTEVAANSRNNLSDSGSSRPQSRFSGVSHSTTTTSRLRLQGFFQKTSSIPGARQDEGPQCPFPNEWQYGTVPEVITNDEDID